jgi:transcriptional regulator with XRE-family HTH domain
MLNFGTRLKTLRTESNYTQSQLAQKLSVTKSMISAYETGIRLPSFETLILISQIFGVTTDYLLGVSETFSKPNTVNLDGLTEEETTALIKLISAMKKSR